MVVSFTSSRTAKTIDATANQQGYLCRTFTMLLVAHYSMSYESRYQRLVPECIKSQALISFVRTSENRLSSIEGR
jgi:hypothetical protein